MWASGGHDGGARRVTASRPAVLLGGLGLAASHTGLWRWMSSVAAAEPVANSCAATGHGFVASEIKRLGVVLTDPRFVQVKDPSITWDGEAWHLFASAWTSLRDG